MPLYVFELSGQSLKLAEAELASLFGTEGAKFSVERRFNGFIIVKSRLDEKKIAKLSERTAFLKYSARLVRELKSLLLKELDKIDWVFVKQPFCVRVIDLAGAKKTNIEARLAGPIYSYFVQKGQRPYVSLEKPKTTILFILRKRKVLVTKLLWKAAKGRFKNRQPSKKPVFHPTSLKPNLARLLVNLSRAKKKDLILDPFCGTGSVLIEAAILKCKPIGIDIDQEMVKGSKLNLEFYDLKAKVFQGDALELQSSFRKNSIDAIATDPPYGRSTKLGSAKSLEELYKKFFVSSHLVLKPKHFMALMYPHYVKAKSLLNKKQWKIIFEASLYVHGGLTRKFLVLQKR